MPANYYHHECIRVCLHAYATLDDGSLCSTDLPRCGTVKWNRFKCLPLQLKGGMCLPAVPWFRQVQQLLHYGRPST